MIQSILTVCTRILSTPNIKGNRKLFHNTKLYTVQIQSKRPTYKRILTNVQVLPFSSDESRVENILNSTLENKTSLLKSQNSVYSETKKHALYLTIHLKPTVSINKVTNIFCNLQKYIDKVSPTNLKTEDDNILGGVGFGPDLLNKVHPDNCLSNNFAHYERKGLFGYIPSTGGDIFVHGKCNEISKLFELAHLLLKSLPEGSIEKFEDIYGWIYRDGRDLSGFTEGTENPKDEDHRHKVAVNIETGGSFVITQKWVHDHDLIDHITDEKLESWMGRKLSDSTELKQKAITAHVSRMTGGSNFQQKKKFEIVRQSQTFGTWSGENGLFFIGYSAKIEALNYMLNRMVGASADGFNDDIMRMSKCVMSNFWYFPGVEELQRLKN